jgi:outer membrane protein assembly factor BamA
LTLAAVHTAAETFDCPACETPVDVTRDRRALWLGWSVSNARSFGYSISREQGGYAGVTTELTRSALGSDGNATAFTADIRGYLRAFPRHGVIAARVAAASSSGDEVARRVFSASGSGPRPAAFAFDTDAIGLMRGFEEGDVIGYHAAVVNIDYRFPLLDVQRGWGTLPIFLRQVHGAVFADVGQAWNGTFNRADLRRSYGAELSFDTVVVNAFPFTLTAGSAWRHDPAGDHRGWVAFGRVGRAF